MNNFINIEIIENNKDLLVPHIFTNIQFNILKKRLQNKELNTNEKYYYYTSISKKLNAIKALFNIEEDCFTNGNEYIINERKLRATKILKKFSKNHKDMEIFIAGSFLYKEKYNDIDIFIFSKYDKDDYIEKSGKDKIHINYLSEEAKDSLFFKSISKISISNFNIPKIEVKEEITIENLISLYQELIIYILKNNDYKKELRSFILECYYLGENIVLNSKQLNEIFDRYKKSKNILNLINKLMIHTLINQEKQNKIKKILKEYIQLNKDARKMTKYFKNLDIYINTYKEALEVGS